MRSTWLLLRIFRHRIGICLFIEFVILFLLSFGDFRPDRPTSALPGFFVAFLIAVVLSLFVQFQHRAVTLPFPVSARQRAWLPMLIFALIWAVGCLTILLAAACRGGDGSSAARLSFYMITRLPLYVLGLLFIVRICRARPHFVGFAPFIVLSFTSTETAWYEACASTYHFWWPILLVVIAVYVCEAPLQLARQDRLCVGQGNKSSASRMGDLNVACSRGTVTWIADTVEGGVVLCTLTGFLGKYLPVWIGNAFQTQLSSSLPTLLVPLALLLGLVAVFRSQYQRTLASGFDRFSAFWATLMQMTIVLIPWAETLGVKKGVVAQCDQCRMAKFLWATCCPHCGHAGSGTIANKKLSRIMQGKPALAPWRRRLFSRVFVPLQILIFLGLFAAAGNRPFAMSTVYLSFNEHQDQQTQARAIGRIRDWVEGHSRLGDVRKYPLDNVKLSLHYPERFRVTVKLRDNGTISVCGYSLRWDHAPSLPLAVAKRLAEEVKDICTLNTRDGSEWDKRGPVFRIRGYLDNQIHWVEPRAGARRSRPVDEQESLPTPITG